MRNLSADGAEQSRELQEPKGHNGRLAIAPLDAPTRRRRIEGSDAPERNDHFSLARKHTPTGDWRLATREPVRLSGVVRRSLMFDWRSILVRRLRGHRAARPCPARADHSLRAVRRGGDRAAASSPARQLSNFQIGPNKSMSKLIALLVPVCLLCLLPARPKVRPKSVSKHHRVGGAAPTAPVAVTVIIAITIVVIITIIRAVWFDLD